MIWFKRVGLAALIVAPALALSLPAQAASPGVAQGTAVSPAALPNTNVAGSPAVFRPAKLSATPHWNGTETCTTSLESFTISNTTSATQTVTSGGATLVVLPSDEKAGICVNTDKAGKTVTLKLTSNSKAKLKVSVT